MKQTTTAWPDHYPSNCPPSQAEPPSGNIYRFMNRKNPKDKDFSSYYELKPDHDWKDKACAARGLTVYTTKEDCVAAAAAVPALKKKHLAIANLPSNSGVIAATPSTNTKNHKTFWPRISAQEMADLFSPVSPAGTVNV